MSHHIAMRILPLIFLLLSSCLIEATTSSSPSLSSFQPRSPLSPRLTPITSPSQVPVSGDSYPTHLPIISSSTSFSNRHILFLGGHGTEDHEIYYQHAYFVAHGANVHFLCANSSHSAEKAWVISDYIKPTYTMSCSYLSEVDLSDYDALFIAGGTPSSAAVRSDTALLQAIDQWLHTPASHASIPKIFALICSGSEVSIDLNLLPYFDKGITGSPVSTLSFIDALQAHNLSTALWQSLNNPPLQSIVYEPVADLSAYIVLGRDPNASPYFVVDIGGVWSVHETPPINASTYGAAIPSPYIHDDFKIITSWDTVPAYPWPSSQQPSSPSVYAGAQIALLVAPGTTTSQVDYLFKYFQATSGNVTVLCPNYIIPYKHSQLYLASTPPSQIEAVLLCDAPLSQWSAQLDSFQVVVVAGGIFASNGDWRTDNELISNMGEYVMSKYGVLAVLESSSDLIAACATFNNSRTQHVTPIVQLGSTIPTINELTADINNAGYNANVYAHATSYSNVVVGVELNDGILEFVQVLEQAFVEWHSDQHSQENDNTLVDIQQI